jgi:hypothetical protein
MHCCIQDFKSCASTNSTTRASLQYAVETYANKNSKPCGLESFRAEDETRTRDPHLGKVMLYQLSYFRISLRTFEAAKIEWIHKNANTSSDFFQKIFWNSIQSSQNFFILMNKDLLAAALLLPVHAFRTIVIPGT